tara:strand:- start:2105 stop:2521 length:417 start_codon:yes stop_codon:yes gene_type:complete
MDLKNSFDKTNLDVESKDILGGPNSFPDYNHHQKYSPSKTYLDTHQSERSVTSDFGIAGDEVLPQSIFSKTELDIENSNPIGGPNRINAGDSNTGGGIYQTATENGVLKDKNGKIVNTLLQQYTPKSKYLDSINRNEL